MEGRQAVRELLIAGRRRVRELLVADDLEPAPIVDEIFELAADAKVTVRRVNRGRLDDVARTDNPQGVVAKAAALHEHDLDELLAGRPFLLGVDGITDPQNLGALLRSAVGAGVSGLVLPRHRSVHVTPAVTKVAAGAVEWMPMAVVAGMPTAQLAAKKAGAWVVGLDADGPTSIFELAHLATEPLLVVVGAEGAGLSRLVRQRCDVLASIPLRGPLASLNAAAAGAVALFELGRHRSG